MPVLDLTDLTNPVGWAPFHPTREAVTMIAYTSSQEANREIARYDKGLVSRDELLFTLRVELWISEAVIKDLLRNFV